MIHQYWYANTRRRLSGGEGFGLVATSDSVTEDIPQLDFTARQLVHCSPGEIGANKGEISLIPTPQGFIAAWKKGGLVDSRGRTGAKVCQALAYIPSGFDLSLIPRIAGSKIWELEPSKVMEGTLEPITEQELKDSARPPSALLADNGELESALVAGLSSSSLSHQRLVIGFGHPFHCLEALLAILPNGLTRRLAFTTATTADEAGAFDVVITPSPKSDIRPDPVLGTYIRTALRYYVHGGVAAVQQWLGDQSRIDDLDVFVERIRRFPIVDGSMFPDPNPRMLQLLRDPGATRSGLAKLLEAGGRLPAGSDIDRLARLAPDPDADARIRAQITKTEPSPLSDPALRQLAVFGMTPRDLKTVFTGAPLEWIDLNVELASVMPGRFSDRIAAGALSTSELADLIGQLRRDSARAELRSLLVDDMIQRALSNRGIEDCLQLGRRELERCPKESRPHLARLLCEAWKRLDTGNGLPLWEPLAQEVMRQPDLLDRTAIAWRKELEAIESVNYGITYKDLLGTTKPNPPTRSRPPKPVPVMIGFAAGIAMTLLSVLLFRTLSDNSPALTPSTTIEVPATSTSAANPPAVVTTVAPTTSGPTTATPATESTQVTTTLAASNTGAP